MIEQPHFSCYDVGIKMLDIGTAIYSININFKVIEMSEFKDKLKKLRKQKGMTREELGNKLGVTASAIGMYERGVRMPKSDILRAISEYFEVDYDYLLAVNYDVPERKESQSGLGLNENVSVYRIEESLVEEVSELAKFVYENPEYLDLFKSIKAVKKDKIIFVKTMIDRLTN